MTEPEIDKEEEETSTVDEEESENTAAEEAGDESAEAAEEANAEEADADEDDAEEGGGEEDAEADEEEDDDSLGATCEIEDAGPCKKLVKATVPAQKVQEILDHNYGELATTVSLPGFRRGRVPRRLLEKRFGEDLPLRVQEGLNQLYKPYHELLATNPEIPTPGGKSMSFNCPIFFPEA